MRGVSCELARGRESVFGPLGWPGVILRHSEGLGGTRHRLISSRPTLRYLLHQGQKPRLLGSCHSPHDQLTHWTDLISRDAGFGVAMSFGVYKQA